MYVCEVENFEVGEALVEEAVSVPKFIGDGGEVGAEALLAVDSVVMELVRRSDGVVQCRATNWAGGCLKDFRGGDLAHLREHNCCVNRSKY